MREGQAKAILSFEDGTTFEGVSPAADIKACGEVTVLTEAVGYQEIITDPAHSGKIVVFTMPQIGNYGTNAEDVTSPEITVAGVVVREMCYKPSNFRSTQSMPDYLAASGVPFIDGVDTRAVTLYLRGKEPQIGTVSITEKG